MNQLSAVRKQLSPLRFSVRLLTTGQIYHAVLIAASTAHDQARVGHAHAASADFVGGAVFIGRAGCELIVDQVDRPLHIAGLIVCSARAQFFALACAIDGALGQTLLLIFMLGALILAECLAVSIAGRVADSAVVSAVEVGAAARIIPKA
jgi:hypothetical protein